MQFSVTVHGNNQAELAAGLRAHLALFEGTSPTTTTTATEKTTRATRSAKPAKEAEETFGETETEETESEETETEEAEAPAVTADQVRAACAAYVKKLIAKGNSAEDARAKVRSILKKNFKVTMVDQLEDDQMSEALELVS